MLNARNRTTVVVAALFAALGGLAAAAQQAPPPSTLSAGGQPSATAQPQATSQPTSAPAGVTALTAKVIEVRGDVQHAAIGGAQWSACKEGDEYPQETKIRTGVRSAIKLQIGLEEPYTAVLIESVGLVSLSELAKTPASKRVRIGVGYGKIRAGVAEGGLQSDFTVDSPVATLSKRGTWNFGLSYDRGTDRFEVFLQDYGLVEALKKVSNERRTILPGQAVTEAMRRWLDEAEMRHNVPIADLYGQEDVEVAFNRIDNAGLGVLGPGEGRSVVVNLTNSNSQAAFGDALNRAIQQQTLPIVGGNQGTQTFERPEGFFGTGGGDQLIQLLVDRNSALVKAGAAKPGKLLIRRSAAEAWLKKNGR